MKHLICYLIILITFSACESTNSDSTASIDSEIQALTTNKAKKEYLLEILKIDQQFRKGQEEKILEKDGIQSKAHNDFIKNRTKIDKENYKKIDRYLEIHGHPNPFEVSLNLTSVPCTVIHHGGSIEEQAKHYPVLLEAYKKGQFTNFIFMKYLGGMYKTKFGKAPKLKSPYTETDEIAFIQKALGLSATKK